MVGNPAHAYLAQGVARDATVFPKPDPAVHPWFRSLFLDDVNAGRARPAPRRQPRVRVMRKGVPAATIKRPAGR